MRSRPLIILALLLPALAGCPSTDGNKETRVLVGTGMDMFGPIELRIHPLTRVTPGVSDAGGKKTLEVRIELADQFGDITKGVGTATFTLARAEALTSTVIDHWSVAIDTPAENKKAWDPITRTYLFRRELPAGDGHTNVDSKNLIVSATLAMPGGQTISGELHLK